MKPTLSILCALAITSMLAACNSRSTATETETTAPPEAAAPAKPEKATRSDAEKNAYLALKKLQAAIEVGLSYRDYSAMLADTNFPVKMFLESEEAKQARASQALRAAMEFYKIALYAWKMSFEYDGVKSLLAEKEEDHPHAYTYALYVNLVSAFPQAAQLVKEKRLNLRDVMQEAWKLASKELANAAPGNVEVSAQSVPETVTKSPTIANRYTKYPTEKEVLLGAANGEADAQYMLGAMLIIGANLPKDAAKGVIMLKSSAEQGNADAQLMLGNQYIFGDGVPRDAAKGREWIQKAAANGNNAAKEFLSIKQ